jgi:hypothetical protein
MKHHVWSESNQVKFISQSVCTCHMFKYEDDAFGMLHHVVCNIVTDVSEELAA